MKVVLSLCLHRYGFDAPDEFMFSSMATLQAIAVIIKRGGLTDEQKEWLENGIPEGAEAQSATDAHVVKYKQPWCPWFTCCY